MLERCQAIGIVPRVNLHVRCGLPVQTFEKLTPIAFKGNTLRRQKHGQGLDSHIAFGKRATSGDWQCPIALLI
jgi:hypothetical protein